jgi:hypothetical protein
MVGLPNGSDKKAFNLATTKYNILLATGSMDGNGLSYHGTTRLPSGEAVNFKDNAPVVAGKEGWLVQIHGIIMVLAWLASASSGMLMARYYKKTWRTVRPLDKDLWFRLHQMFMGSTVLLTIAGFFIILSEEAWEPLTMAALKRNPHPAIGMVCFVTAMIQPMMAALRPHPGANLRWLFNWAHWCLGNISFLFAIVAIFLAMEFDSVNMPKEVTYALMAYVVVHVMTHFILTFQRCHSDHHPRQVDNLF